MKICSECGEEKEISEFRRNRWARDYHRSECKVCSSKRDVRYHLKARYPERFEAQNA